MLQTTLGCGRSTRHDDAHSQRRKRLPTLGIVRFTNMTDDINMHLCRHHHRKRLELAQHAVVRCLYMLADMTTTVVSHAVGTILADRIQMLGMDVKRRQQ